MTTSSDQYLKLCVKCEQEKPADEGYFNLCADRSDGLSSWCRECHRSNSRRYKNENRYRAQVADENLRAFKLGVPGTLREEEWQALCETYNHRCLSCGRSGRALAIDHVIPLSAGGLNVITNCQPLCKECNSRKGVKLMDYRPATDRGAGL